MGGFCQCLTFIQDEKPRGRILFGAPIHGQEGEDFLTDRFQATFVGGIHGNTHERLAIPPYLIHEPGGARCFTGTRRAKEEEMLEGIRVMEEEGEARLNPFAPVGSVDRRHCVVERWGALTPSFIGYGPERA